MVMIKQGVVSEGKIEIYNDKTGVFNPVITTLKEKCPKCGALLMKEGKVIRCLICDYRRNDDK